MLSKFYLINTKLIILLLLNVIAIFTYKVTINATLSKYFGYSEEFLSTSNFVFAVGFMIGVLFAKIILNYRMLFLNIVKLCFIGLFFTVIADFVIIYYNLPNILYLINIVIEALLSSIAIYIIQYHIDIKLIKNDKKGLIQGLLTSKQYIIKFLFPIIASFIIENYHPLANLILPAFFYLYIVFYIIKINRYSLRKEYIKYERKLNLKTKKTFKWKSVSKRIFFNELKYTLSKKNFQEVFKKKKERKVLFVVRILIQNVFRPFYDLYMVLLLINIFKYSMTEATFLVSLMVFGQSLSIFTGMISDFFQKIKKYFLLQLISLFVFAIFLSLMLLYSLGVLQLSYNVLAILILIMGINRNFFGDYYNREIFFYSKRESINNIKPLVNLLSELSHSLSYVLCSILFYFLGYIGILYVLIVLIVILVITMKKRNFIFI